VRKRIIILICLCIAVGVGAVFFHLRRGPETKYVTALVEQGTLNEITCTGTLKPLMVVDVGTQVSGGIEKVLVEVESRVKTGDLLALVDPAPFEAKLVQARASRDQAKLSLSKSKLALEESDRLFMRKKALWEDHSIPENEYLTAKNQAEQADTDVQIEESRLIEAKARLRETELELKNTRIEAPLDGVVMECKAYAGQSLAATYQTPVLFKVAKDLSQMQIEAQVDEADVGVVSKGQPVSYTVPAFPSQNFSGIVREILTETKTKQSIVTYTVAIDVGNPEFKLRPGMTANVTITVGEAAADALIIPEQALHFFPDAELQKKAEQAPDMVLKAGEAQVWKLESDNTLKPLKVRVGKVGLDRVQISSEDLKPGDSVVVELAGDAIRKKD